MVRSRKGAIAHFALKGPIAGVFSVVASELVGPGEFPSASSPVALVRLFSRMSSQVGLEMRTFGVFFYTSNVRTGMNSRLSLAVTAQRHFRIGKM